MTGTGTTFDSVRRLGLALPGVEEGKFYGSPALKLGGKMLACLPVNRSAEPNTLVVSIDLDERDVLVAAEPETYYVTDHYAGHPCVLVRLASIDEEALGDLLSMARRYLSAG